MNMPGFTATASIYRTTGLYRMTVGSDLSRNSIEAAQCSAGTARPCHLPEGWQICCYPPHEGRIPYVKECADLYDTVFNQCNGNVGVPGTALFLHCVERGECFWMQCIERVLGSEYAQCTGIV